ncbi:hypothetical protein BV25DRAFT_1576250 [Artomyces pyxidatus]|uniref:Uncharacterized protein n=1 Tax=Artomyces pyxidatus TaxID=48021 RepID=A0ACB8SJN4_9AGAM|nr:hypothetical protein BV25DRAFT_1576250 [Artomyces pyxidatus]
MSSPCSCLRGCSLLRSAVAWLDLQLCSLADIQYHVDARRCSLTDKPGLTPRERLFTRSFARSPCCSIDRRSETQPGQVEVVNRDESCLHSGLRAYKVKPQVCSRCSAVKYCLNECQQQYLPILQPDYVKSHPISPYVWSSAFRPRPRSSLMILKISKSCMTANMAVLSHLDPPPSWDHHSSLTKRELKAQKGRILSLFSKIGFRRVVVSYFCLAKYSRHASPAVLVLVR